MAKKYIHGCLHRLKHNHAHILNEIPEMSRKLSGVEFVFFYSFFLPLGYDYDDVKMGM
jgi:hypothetical protein